MIATMRLLHYLKEEIYTKICCKLGLDSGFSVTKDSYIEYPTSAIKRVNLFNIQYGQYGHIWFMYVHIAFPRFKCDYESFPKVLYDAYTNLFGDEVMMGFPVYDALNCI